MVDPTGLLLATIYGLYVGCVYISLAVGLNLIFGVMKVVNFAHGEVMILGAYITYTIWSALGLNPYIALLGSVAVITAVGMVLERLCFRPILGVGKLNEIFVSLGLIILLQNLMVRIWMTDPRRIISPYEFIYAFSYGVVRFPLDYTIVVVVTAAVLAGLSIFLKTTHFGRGLRATSQNRRAAMLMGVNVERADMISFGLGCALATIAGSFLGMASGFDPYAGVLPCIKAFAIIILGGLGSIPGAIVGGLMIGLAEGLTALIIGSGWRHAITFAVLIAVLVVKPTGIFGEAGE